MNYILKHIEKYHPNRPGIKLKGIKAIVVHYTQNDLPQATALFHYEYLNRKYVTRKNESGKIIYYEKDGVTPFRFGSAHVFCDIENIVETIPLNEVSWGCGDKNFNGGYKEIAYKLFNGKQNYYTINVEICNYDVIKNSDEDWNKSVDNARNFIKFYCEKNNLRINIDKSLSLQSVNNLNDNDVLILRHFDITGKMCPLPFVKDFKKWENFVNSLIM